MVKFIRIAISILPAWIHRLKPKSPGMSSEVVFGQSSKATLSHAVRDLFDDFSVRASLGKLNSDCRRIYSEAQKLALENGRHASQRKNRNMKSYQQIREEFKTLDRACTEIQRLEERLDSHAATAPKTATAPPKPVALPQSPPKAPAARPAPKLSDLSREEIVAAMDICNREHDSETLGLLYRELQSRRRN
jgi:hypothetical protein